MAALLLTPPTEMIHLSGISWQTYEIKQLQDDAYVNTRTSQFFPNLPIPEISRFLQQAEMIDYLELVRAFRQWVRSQIQA